MRIGNSGKSAPLVLAALLLAGCAASTAASTPESAATPVAKRRPAGDGRDGADDADL